MAADLVHASNNSFWRLTTFQKRFFYFSSLNVLIIAGILLYSNLSPSVYRRDFVNNVGKYRNANLNSGSLFIDCRFSDYNNEAALAIKSRVLSKLSLTKSIKVYKPGVPLAFQEDKHITLMPNLTQTKDVKHGHKRIEKLYTDDIGITSQKTCAVVGNGGILLDSGCGREIDAHDFVIRNNLAEINEYTADVGSKTSIMTLNGATLRGIVESLKKNGSDQKSLHDFSKMRFLNDTVLWYIKSLKKEQKDNLGALYSIVEKNKMTLRLAYSPEEVRTFAIKIWDIKRPTTGLIVYTFLAGFCDKISLYGFYPFSTDKSGNHVRHHYYANITFNYQKAATNGHTFVAEYQMFKKLHQQGALRLIGENTCVEQHSMHDK